MQLGLTATPKRENNADTYAYFGEPVYTYALKDGINDGFLTPFKVRQIETTLDEYFYSPDDDVLEGEVEGDRVYTESDFNRIISAWHSGSPNRTLYSISSGPFDVIISPA